ncbi:MAG TPA: FHA domain-containing protein, partial [Roseiarcus sp.]|nr:FHA domain-containing protein [Roseiarcus sp.]
MTLRLSIENLDRLPDGGPLRVEVKGRGLDIGRDAHLDWTLPDPSRYVSSKHCEIRFRDGGYWLHDVSTNGTFVNGAQFRLDAPHLLRNGDRLSIGPYVIAVTIEGEAGAVASASPAALAAAARADVWSPVGEAAAPEDRGAYRAQRPR